MIRYPKFDELTLSYATKYHWNRTDIIKRAVAPPGNDIMDSWFFVEDVGVNAVYIRGWEVLGKLAATVGDAKLEQECATTAANLTAILVRLEKRTQDFLWLSLLVSIASELESVPCNE